MDDTLRSEATDRLLTAYRTREPIDPLTATGTARNDATFRADLEAERRSLQDDVDKVKIYPILKLGIGYRF